MHRGQKGLRGGQKFDVGQLCVHLDALETAFGSSAGFERQQVLVAEVESEFIKIGLEGDGLAGAEIIGLGARFIGELAKIRLRPGNEKESSRPVPRIGSIDGPNVDIRCRAAGAKPWPQVRGRW